MSEFLKNNEWASQHRLDGKILTVHCRFVCVPWAYPEWGGGGRGSRPTLKNHKNIGFLCKTSQDPLKNHLATKPAFKVGPSSALQGNAISMTFRWPVDDGPFIAVFGSSIPSSTKNKKGIKLGPPLTKLSGIVHVFLVLFEFKLCILMDFPI